VIHAGIYYPTGSLKARLCVAGRRQLYPYCIDRGIKTSRRGKLIVATAENEIESLQALLVRGRQNGVDDLEWLTAAEAVKMEPALHCLGAIHSPSTGIVDSHGLMLGLQADLESAGGVISFGSSVIGIEPGLNGITVRTSNNDEQLAISALEVVNCAGLSAVTVARTTTRVDSAIWPQACYSKGNYFRLNGASPFAHLVYPAPVPGGLGVHLALDLSGNARFGPDVEAVQSAEVSLAVDPARANDFYASIRRYWPGLKDGSLLPDYAGIRPKIALDGSQATDFSILTEKDHGVGGLVHCLGIESPGLTSCLAIADEVITRLGI
jgi:L-2-hydroxyglutarate oxidase LhgO